MAEIRLSSSEVEMLHDLVWDPALPSTPELDRLRDKLERTRTEMAYPPPVDPDLRAVQEAAKARVLTQEIFDEALRDAVAGGASLRTVAVAAGISHQRVAQIVGPRLEADEG